MRISIKELKNLIRESVQINEWGMTAQDIIEDDEPIWWGASKAWKIAEKHGTDPDEMRQFLEQNIMNINDKWVVGAKELLIWLGY